MNPTNEYIKQKWGNRPQIELAKEIARLDARENGRECGSKDYERYKGYVNKWFSVKSDQEPGKHYLLLLSKILNVSVESILRGKDIINEYGDRPTAYSAAKSGDENTIDRLFGNAEADIRLHTTDEYGKSFVDYVIEFNHYHAFKKAIENGYGYFAGNSQLLLNQCSGTEHNYYKLTKMIIENDDKEMFIKAFGINHYGESEEASPISVFYYHKVLITDDIIVAILKTNNILEWLMEYRCFSETERDLFGRSWNVLEYYEYLQPIVDRIPSVLCGFNYLLKKCIEEGEYEPLSLMVNRAVAIVQDITDIIMDYKSEFEIVKYYNSSDTVIQLKTCRISYPLGFVPYVEDYNKIKDEKLRRKSIFVNETIDKLRRTK